MEKVNCNIKTVPRKDMHKEYTIHPNRVSYMGRMYGDDVLTVETFVEKEEVLVCVRIAYVLPLGRNDAEILERQFAKLESEVRRVRLFYISSFSNYDIHGDSIDIKII
jgi:hypothetical protein